MTDKKRDTMQLRVLHLCKERGIDTSKLHVDVLRKTDTTRVYVHLPDTKVKDNLADSLKDDLGVTSVKIISSESPPEQYIG